MAALGELFAAAGVRERALLVLTLTVAALVALAFAFAAYTVLLRVRSVLRARRWRALSARWEGPVLEALRDPSRAPAVHAAVLPPDRLRFVRFVLEYARRMRGEEREVLRALAAPYLPAIAQRTWSPRVEVRARAVQTLGALGLPGHAAEVLTALDDPSPLVAMVAARALCSADHPEYAPAVLQRIGRFETWSRGFLASMLASVGPGAAPALRQALGDRSRQALTRAVAADALHALKDFAAADLAAEAAVQEQDRELVAAALRLLGATGRPEHAPSIRAGCSSPDPAVRAAAYSALAALGREEDRALLLEGVGDPSTWVALQAGRGLVASGGRDLLRELGGSDDPRAPLARQILLEEGEPR